MKVNRVKNITSGVLRIRPSCIVYFFGSVRSSRSGNLCLSVCLSVCLTVVTVISCLEHSILIFLAQIFKLFSQHSVCTHSALSWHSLSSLSSSYFIYFIIQTEPKILRLVQVCIGELEPEQLVGAIKNHPAHV